MSKVGNITIPGDVNVWPHERKTAEALARAGYDVTFIGVDNGNHVKTADVLIDGLIWEMKSPTSSRTDMIQKNLRRALHQSVNVIFDSRRMKGLPNHVIERELRIRARELRTLQRLIYINRKGEVVIVC